MLFLCKCAHCGKANEAELSHLARVELDFQDQVIRYICPECKRQSEMSLLTSNKLNEKPLPKMITMRG